MGCAISTADITALSYDTVDEGCLINENVYEIQIAPDDTYFACSSTTTFTCANAGETLLLNGVEDPDGMYEFACLSDRDLFAQGLNSFVGQNEETGRYLISLYELEDLPTFECDSTSGVEGDPHVKLWNGTWYDWQGECDAVFLHAPDYGRSSDEGANTCTGGLDVHIRTKIRYDYSFMESIAVRIGTDIFEVSSFGGSIFNGISNPDYPITTDCGNTITYSPISEMQHDFLVDLGEGARLDLSTFKDMVSLKVFHTDSPTADKWFGSSSGLMGTFHESNTVARDMTTILDNPNDFAQEWQVLDSDPKLFQNPNRVPQFPEKCKLPMERATAGRRRRLLGDAISEEEAAEACAHWKQDEKAHCIADVMATNDLDMASLHF